jgi:hypothetical protein
MSSAKTKAVSSSSNTFKPVQNILKHTSQEEKPLIELTIKEPFSPAVEEFDGPTAFQKYLTENVEEMNPLTTYKLNKKYKVEGYRITKIKGVIGLQKVRNTVAQSSDDETSGFHTCDTENRFADLETRFNEMDSRQEEIENKIGEILHCLEMLKTQWMMASQGPLPPNGSQPPPHPHIHPSLVTNMGTSPMSPQFPIKRC